VTNDTDTDSSLVSTFPPWIAESSEGGEQRETGKQKRNGEDEARYAERLKGKGKD
jgi:hypothetical protein